MRYSNINPEQLTARILHDRAEETERIAYVHELNVEVHELLASKHKDKNVRRKAADVLKQTEGPGSRIAAKVHRKAADRFKDGLSKTQRQAIREKILHNLVVETEGSHLHYSLIMERLDRSETLTPDEERLLDAATEILPVLDDRHELLTTKLKELRKEVKT